tara:strand:- start:205 stop:537 length:333 start_codon:yes stop_codon:yes gene_type:complete
MAFKLNGWSPFTKDPKKTKKRILKATDIQTPDAIVGTEELESDFDLKAGSGNVAGGSVNVYRQGFNKYVKHEETGDYVHVPRSEIRKLKKEGSYTTTKKIKKNQKNKSNG